MDNLVKSLDTFDPGWSKKGYLNQFISILRDLVIPVYSKLDSRIENNEAILSKEWDLISTALKEARFFELFIPLKYGGWEAPEEDIYFIMELLGYSSPSIGVIFVSHGRAVDVVLGGTEGQKKKYLPGMKEGLLGAIAMTEEKAGSDVTAIELIAKRAGDHYLLNGQKIFVSNTGLANIYTVLANTKGLKGSRSLTVFILEKGVPGFTMRGLPEKDGLKALPVGRLIFENTRLPLENVVGSEGTGLMLTLDVIDRGRIHIAGICCGLAHRIFDEIYSYAHQRRQFDHPLTSSQDISFKISDMYSQMNAARGLCLHALKHLGTSEYRLASSQAKLFATRMVMEVAAKAQMIMGGRGYFRTDLVNQLSADARGMEYLEGTSNVQKMIIARELLKLYYKERG